MSTLLSIPEFEISWLLSVALSTQVIMFRRNNFLRHGHREFSTSSYRTPASVTTKMINVAISASVAAVRNFFSYQC